MWEKFCQWLLKIAGGVPAEELAASSGRVTALQAAVKKLKADLEVVTNAAFKASRQLDVAKWTNPYDVELAPGLLPANFVKHTWEMWRRIARQDGKLGSVECFAGGPNAAGLYWALAHASRSAEEAIGNLKNEDGMTSDFVHALREQLENAHRLLGMQASVAVGQIFQNLRPALKEVSVGADLLVMVSGSGLVPRGGVRLFWIQIKRATEGSPLELDVYREPNAAGRTQLEAIRAVHSTAAGSFGLYALASSAYDFFASTPVPRLNHVVPKNPLTCKVDLGDLGVRLQELLLALAKEASLGEFKSGKEVLEYVDNLAAEKAIIPLAVLSVASGYDMHAGHDLIQQIKAGWEARLVEHRRKLSRNVTRQIENTQSTTRDGGPSQER